MNPYEKLGKFILEHNFEFKEMIMILAGITLYVAQLFVAFELAWILSLISGGIVGCGLVSYLSRRERNKRLRAHRDQSPY